MAATALLARPAAAQGGVPGYPDNFMEFDIREVKMLPDYCIHSEYFRQKVGGNNMAEKARWQARMGDMFIHIHHYCFGLLKTNRAMLLTKTKQYREFYLWDSLKEFDYVISQAPPQFVLLPEILTRKGENLIRLNRGALGVIELERAMQLNPGYWPPYAQLADYYKSTGDQTKARAVLEKGLSFAPGAVALTRRLNELDGGIAPTTPQRE